MTRPKKRRIQRDSMQETFGEWLKRTRKKQGLTQQQLADRVKVSKQYISNLERNARHGTSGAKPTPSAKVVKRIATGLEVPESEALRAAGYYPEEAEIDPRQTQLLSYFLELSDNERDDALALIETIYRRRERTRKIPMPSVSKGAQSHARPSKARKRG